MIALYFILTDDLRSAAGFGRHLLRSFRRLMPNRPEPDQSEAKKNALLTGEQFRAAVSDLAKNLGHGVTEPPPTKDEVTAVFFALAALGCLRLVASRGLLADMAGVPRGRVHAAIKSLEAVDLLTTDLTLDSAAGPAFAGRPWRPCGILHCQRGCRHAPPSLRPIGVRVAVQSGGHPRPRSVRPRRLGTSNGRSLDVRWES